MSKSATVDLTKGPLLKGIIKYALPIIFTNILQVLFNSADIIVVGNFASDTAMGAVGATSAIYNLTVNLVVGLSVGASVVAGKCFGSNDKKGLSEVVHTVFPLGLIVGVCFAFLGFFVARPVLNLLSTPTDFIDQSTLYLKIIFWGLPFSMLFNFFAGILRALGNTSTPLIILTVSGALNAGLNLLFVIVFKMDVAGVAVATLISQFVSCVVFITYFCVTKDDFKLSFKKIRIYKNKLKAIIRIGLPAGLQTSMFSISNLVVQSAVNGFGNDAVTGFAATNSIDGITYSCMNAFQQTAMAYVAQYRGAGKTDKLKKISLLCVSCVAVIGFVLGNCVYLFSPTLVSIYKGNNKEVIYYGSQALKFIGTMYFICGIYETLTGILRGMEYSLSTTVISIMGICGVRILWINTVFRVKNTFDVLMTVYPVSWAISAIILATLLVYALKKKTKPKKEDGASGDVFVEK